MRFLLVLALATSAHAAAWSSIEVRANRPATVIVDGQSRGRAPVTVRVPPGFHDVKVVDETTGLTRHKPFVAPESHALNQVLDLEFQGGASRPPEVPPVPVATPPPAPARAFKHENPAWAGNVWWRRYPSGRGPSIRGTRGFRGR